jgi:putative polyhydroxyalkanoate system protein
MADIEIRRVHNLGLKAARTAADKMAEHLGKKFGLRGDWDGNVLRFERPGVNGALAITDKDLNLSVTLGFLLKAMKGSIDAAVNRELDELFAKAPAPAAKGSAATSKPAPAVVKPGAGAKKAAPRPKKGG